MVLAPMADVTDAAFRQIIAKYSRGKLARTGENRGGPDVFWTEFVSADGLCHPVGRERLKVDLMYTEGERPIVAQLFSANPEKMEQAAALVRELGFDGLDINMGCPDKTIEKQGAGAALIKTPALAREIIAAAKRGAGNLPVSVKTRLGYNQNILDTWLPELLAAEPAVVTVHARTRKEMSLVPARWEEVTRAVAIRNQLGSKSLIFGNGDVKNILEAKQRVRETGADGVMLGRAIFGNPWLFAEHQPALQEKLSVLLEHVLLFDELLGSHKSFAIMKKHFKAYVTGWDGAAELRQRLMEANTAGEVRVILERALCG
jgi:nifR3 family TIM-barrel protein